MEKAIAKDVKQTLKKEFPELKFPKEFEKEIEKYISEEPQDGYNIGHCNEIINQIAELQKVKKDEVIRNMFFMLVGRLLICRYHGGHNETDKKK